MRYTEEMISHTRLEKFRKVIGRRQKGMVVILEDIHDPHNAQAILRSCDAFGVQEVYFIFNKTKAYKPQKLGRASSSSANKWLNYTFFDTPEACIQQLRDQHYTIYGTVVHTAAQSLFETDFLPAQKIALVVGNEHEGLSGVMTDNLDYALYLPMRGMVESFNVSVAAAIFMYEIVRQRAVSGKSYALSKKDQAILLKDFINR